MAKDIKYYDDQIYRWFYEGGKIHPPKMDLPKAVKERLEFFLDQTDFGLTYLGCLEAVLAYDEEKVKKEIEMGGDWLPVSKEFKEWRDGTGSELPYHSSKEQIIALALIYGWSDDDE